MALMAAPRHRARGGSVAALVLALGLAACTADGGEDHVFAPVITDDAAYVGREDGGVYAVDLTGEDAGELWRYDTDGGVIFSPAVAHGRIYAGTTGGYLYALDAHSGELRWRYDAGSDLMFSPAVDDDTVYIGSADGHLHAVAADTGEQRWRYAMERRLLTWPPFARGAPGFHAALHDGVVYVAGRHGRLHGIDVATGEQVRELDTGADDTPPAVRDGVLYTGDDGEVIAVDLATWTISWRSEVGEGSIRFPNPGAEAVYVGDDAGGVHAVSAHDGSVRWSFATDGAVHSIPAPHDELVLVGSHDGNLYALDRTSGRQQWRHFVGEGVQFDGTAASAAIADDIAYFGVDDHGLVGVDVQSGETRWRYEPTQ